MLIVTRKAIRQHRGERQPPGAQGRAQARAAAEAEPQHAAEQIDQRRIGERDRDPDLALVEVQLRDPEREQHQQVEVDDPQRAPEVEQAEEEHQRHRDPDVGRVQDVAELALVAAGHRPRDLVAGPRLADRAGHPVDLHLRDLAAVGRVPHLPEAAVGLDRGGQATVAARLLGDVGIGVGDLDRPGRADLESLRGLRERSGLGWRRERRPRGLGARLGARGAGEGEQDDRDGERDRDRDGLTDAT